METVVAETPLLPATSCIVTDEVLVSRIPPGFGLAVRGSVTQHLRAEAAVNGRAPRIDKHYRRR
jgi:hypothetical protein